MALSTTIVIQGTADLTKTHDHVAATPAKHPMNATIAMLTGTGAGLADLVWSDNRSTAGTDSLDLNGGGLTDYHGAAFNLAKLKVVFIKAAAGNAADLRVTRPSAGVPLLGATGDFIAIPPGCTFLWVAPSAGITVTATTADLLDIVAASGTLSYDITLIGTSA